MASHPDTLDLDWSTLTDLSMSDAARIDTIRALEDLKARACAAQAQLTADLDDSVRRRHADLGLPADQRGRGVAGQVALARRESSAKASRLLGLARALTAELPHTLTAMKVGVLSEWRATLIARETACLSAEDRRAVDAQISAPVGDNGDGYRFDGWGDRRLVAEVQKVVYATDPLGVINRRAHAESERRVSVRPAPDAMTQLSALLPAAQGVAVWATLSRAADQARAAGDTRSRGQVMADTLVERITGQARAGAVPVAVNLVVSDTTLLGDGDEPAWLAGFGPITPDAARELARRGNTDAQASLRRLYAKPKTGQLVSMDSVARYFPDGLGLFLELRDQTCRTPWCDAPIRERDHVINHGADGPTSAINGQGLCQQCNHTKQAPGWRSRPITGPPDQRHTVETLTPTGHTVTSTAPLAPTPAVIRRSSRGEYEFSRQLTLVLAS